MRPLMRVTTMSCMDLWAEPFDFRGDVVVTLRPQEVPVRWAADPAHQTYGLVQRRVSSLGLKVEVPAAPLGVKAGGDRDRLDQRRLANSVFSNHQCHSRI